MKTATYPLPKGRSVTFTFDGLRLDAEWHPRLPDGKLGLKLLPHYRAARNRFLSELTPFFGNMLVVDL